VGAGVFFLLSKNEILPFFTGQIDKKIYIRLREESGHLYKLNKLIANF